MSVKTPSPRQLAIFDQIRIPGVSIAVNAVAGSGKTTTLVWSLSHIPTDSFVPPSILVVAFNKDIVENLKPKLPPSVNCATFNSIGHRILMRQEPKPRLEASKMSKLARQVLEFSDPDYKSILRLVGLAKGLCHIASVQEVLDLAKRHDLPLEEPQASAASTIRLLNKSIEVSKVEIDFNDQLFLPIIQKLPFVQYDYVFVDEAQDLNEIQMEIVARSLKPTGRLITVGDPHQAIYGFRGADSNAYSRMVERFGCTELLLDICYRCSRTVVAEAQHFVSHILPRPDAPEGLVKTLPQLDPTFLQQTDAVLCRLSAPLIGFAYELLRRSIPCRILGKDIGASLISIINKMRAPDLPQLGDRLSLWHSREVARAIESGEDALAERVSDQYDALCMFMASLDEDSRTIADLIASIELMFSDRRGGITLSTIHKSKGLEYPRVFILDRHLMPSRFARQPWQKVQENNLQYVAITRAQEELYYINSQSIKPVS